MMDEVILQQVGNVRLAGAVMDEVIATAGQ